MGQKVLVDYDALDEALAFIRSNHDVSKLDWYDVLEGEV